MIADISDTGFRLKLSEMGFKGNNLPLRLASIVRHDSFSDVAVLRYDGETRREALTRLSSLVVETVV